MFEKTDLNVYMTIPEEYSFTVYKVVDLYEPTWMGRRMAILEMEVPDGAGRVVVNYADWDHTSTRGLLRVEKATPIRFLDRHGKELTPEFLEDTIAGWRGNGWPPYYLNSPYRIGQLYEATYFCVDPEVTCAPGINCFASLEDVLEYWSTEWGDEFPSAILSSEEYYSSEYNPADDDEYYEEEEEDEEEE